MIENQDKILSLSEASRLTGYHQDYLGQLCRSGKLRGQKIGRNWTTTQSAISELQAGLAGEGQVTEALPSLNSVAVHVLQAENPSSVIPEATSHRGLSGIHESSIPSTAADWDDKVTANAAEQEQSNPQKFEELSTDNFDVNAANFFAGLTESPIVNPPSVNHVSFVKQQMQDLHLRNSVESLENKVAGLEAGAPTGNSEIQSQTAWIPNQVWDDTKVGDQNNLTNKFASNFDFGENENVPIAQSNNGISSADVKKLFSSFENPKSQNKFAVATASTIAVVGLFASVVLAQPNLLAPFFGEDSNSHISYTADNGKVGGVVAVTNGSDSNPQGQVLGTTVVVHSAQQPVTEITESYIDRLILFNLEQLMNSGWVKGAKGDPGPAGPAGSGGGGSGPVYIQPYIPYTPTTSNPGGTLAAFTHLSSDTFNTRTAAVVQNLTVGGNTSVTGNLSVTGTITGSVSGSIDPGFTEGSVVFQGASGLDEDNANFFWNDTTNRLGLGTVSPQGTLDIRQSANGTPIIYVRRATDVLSTGDFITYTSADGLTNLFRVDNGGNVSASGSISGGAQTITSTSQPQLRVQYDGSNEWTSSTNATGGTTWAMLGSNADLNINFAGATDGDFSINTDDLFVDTSTGYVGIGTTSPQSLLHVSNNADSSTLLQITNTTAGTSAQAAIQVASNAGYVGFYKYSTARTTYKTAVAPDAILYNSAGGNITILNDNASGNINLTAGGASTPHLVVASTGNVGIGTSAPVSGKLDIRGPLGTASWKTLPTDGTGGFNYGLAFVQDDSTASGTTGYFRMVNTDGTLVSGRNILGIQLAGGGDRLLVPGNTGLVDMSADNKIRFCGPSGSCITASELQVNKIRLSPSFATADALTDPGDGGVHFPGNSYFATSTGNVGIGTASPFGKLNVSAVPTATANYGVASIGSGAWDGSTAGFYTGSSSGTVLAVNSASAFSGNLLDLQTGGVSRLRVGATSAAGDTLLDVRDSAGSVFSITSSNGVTEGEISIRGNRFISTSGNTWVMGNSSYPFILTGPGGGAQLAAVATPLYIRTTNTGAGTIYIAADPTGGAATPSGSDTAKPVVIGSTTTAETGAFVELGQDTKLRSGKTFQWPTGIIDSLGNVGIGFTSGMYAELMVNNTIRIDDNSGSGTGSDTLGSAPELYIGTTGGGGAFQYNALGGLDLWQYNGSWGQTVTYSKNGNVGIGTSSPDAKLELAGSVATSAWGLNGIQLQGTAATFTDSSTAAAGTATNAAISSLGQSTLASTNAVTTTNAYGLYLAGAPISGANQTLTNTSALYIGAAATVDGTGATPTNSYGLYVNAQTGATNNYAAVFSGGNVGIGTTSPATKLNVSGGDIRIDEVSQSSYQASNALVFRSWQNGTPLTWTMRQQAPDAGTQYFEMQNYGGTPMMVMDSGGGLIAQNVIGAGLSGSSRAGDFIHLSYTAGLGSLYTGSHSADIQIGNNWMRFDHTTANVGIGSDLSPAAALTIGADGGAGVANGAGDAYIQSDLEVDGTLTVAGATTYSGALSVITTTSPQLTVGYDSSNKFTTAVASDGGTTWAMLGSDADLNINFAGATDGDFSINTDDLFVDTSNGRVGIGTAVPSYGLHVQNDLGLGIARSTGRFWQIVPDSVDQSTLRISAESISNALVLKASSDLYSVVYSETPILTLSSSSKLYLNAGEGGGGGSVVFGKRTGDDLILPVNYEFYAAGAKTANYSGVLFNNTATSSTGSVNKYGLEIQNTGTWDGASAKNVGLYISSVTGGTNNYDAIFNGGGNVGIGTTTPTAKTEVYGDLRYGGSNPATGVTVSDNPLTIGATTVNVSSTTGYPTSGTLVIESEAMTYTGISGNAFTGVTRGVLGTSATSHASATRIDSYISIAQRDDTTPKFTLTAAGRASFGRAAPSTAYGGGVYPTVEIGPLDSGFPQAVGGAAMLSLNAGAGAPPSVVFARDSVQQWIITDRSDDPGRLSFMNASSAQLFNFLQNGSFGINDTSPDANLEVVNDSSGDSFLVADSGDGDTSPFVIQGDGDVGIGTTSPTYKLDVSNGTNSTLRVNTGTNQGVYVTDGALPGYLPSGNFLFSVAGNAADFVGLDFNARTAGAVPFISMRREDVQKWTFTVDSADELNFRVGNAAGASSLTLLSNGNVGIGDTTPSALLDVNNTTTTTITAAANARVLNLQGAFTEAGSGVHARITGMEITPPTITAGAATVTNTASLYISDAPTATVTGGNYSLWVDSGNSRFDGALQLNGGSFPSTGEGMELLASNDTGYIQMYNRDTSSWGDLQINTEDLLFANVGGFTTFQGANVGIGGGDGSPDATLEVINDGSGDSFLVADNLDGDTSPFVIQADGDVGIGIASPIATFHVQTTAVSGGTFAIIKNGASNATTNEARLSLAPHSGFDPTTAPYIRSVNEGNNAGVRLGTYNGSLSDALTILANGSVGIGINTPDGLLELAGNRTQAAWGLNGIQLQGTAATFTDSSTVAAGTAPNAVFNSFGQPTLAASNLTVTTTNAATVYIAAAPAAGTNQTITNAYALWVDAGTARFDGDVTVAGTLTGAGSGTFGYFSRSGTTITPATSGDSLSFPGSAGQSQQFGLGATAGLDSLAVGHFAVAGGSSASTAIGTSAIAGTSSVAVGEGANANSFVGTAIGAAASEAFSYGVAIGYNATTTATNQFVSGSNTAAITNVFFGNGVTNAAPSGFVLQGSGGSGADVAGASVTIAGGKGTGNAAGGDILFQTSDAGVSSSTLQSLTTKLIVKTSGNVGIGATAPGAKLEVASEQLFAYPTMGLGKGSIHINPVAATNGDTTAITFGGSSSGSVINSGQAGIYVQSSVAYGTKMYFGTASAFGTGSETRMMIDNLGNVGIADITPDASLEVVNDGSGDSFLVADGSDGDTTPFVIQEDGDVGVGTASPVGKFSVQSGISAASMTLGSTTGISQSLNLDGTGWGMYFGVDTATGNGWIQQGRTSSATAYNLSLQAAGGNVGIGTVNAAEKLSVVAGTLGSGLGAFKTTGTFPITSGVTAYGSNFEFTTARDSDTSTNYAMNVSLLSSYVASDGAGREVGGIRVTTVDPGGNATLYGIKVDSAALGGTTSYGVYSNAAFGGNNSYGVYGTTQGGPTAVGVYGESSNTGGTRDSYGGMFRIVGNVTQNAYGVYSSPANAPTITGTYYGVYSTISGSTVTGAKAAGLFTDGTTTSTFNNGTYAALFAGGNVSIGSDTSPGAALVVGSDATMGVANGAGDGYFQNDLEVDGSTTTALLTTGNITLSNTTTTINSVNANPTISFQGNGGTFFEISRPNGTSTLLTTQTELRFESILRLEGPGKLLTGGGLDLFVNPDLTGTLVLGAETTSETTHIIELAESTVLRSGESLQWTTGIIDTTGKVGIGTISPDAKLEIAGNLSSAAWGFNGIQLQNTAGTYTDSSTAAAGTATNAVFNSFGQPTLAATNAITTTNAANVYIAAAPAAGTNQTITNAYALWVDDGVSRFDGDVRVGSPTGGDAVLDSVGRAYIDPGNVNFGVDTGLAVSARHPSTNSLTVQQMNSGTDQTYPLQVWNRLDGATMASMGVRGELRARSSTVTAMDTYAITGTIDPIASTTVTGTLTQFSKDFMVGDRITVSGETRVVTVITNDTTLTVDTAFSDNANDLTPDRLPSEFSVLDSSGNIDFMIQDSGFVGIGDISADYKLEVTAAASSDSSFALSDGDVATGLTDIGETDAYALFRPISSTAGGLKLEALSDTDASALNMYGFIGSTDPTDTTAAVKIVGAKKNTTNVQALGALETVLQVANNATNLFTILGGGKIGIGDVTSIASGNLPAGSVVIGNGALCVDNGGDNCDDAGRTAGTVYSVGADVTGIDLAENYPSTDTSLVSGELVMIDEVNNEFIKRANKPYGKTLLGVVSTAPGVTLGGFRGSSEFSATKQYPIALTGRVPVKVTNENGNILPGDYLTASREFSGFAMKATRSGQIIGQALEGFNSSTPSSSGVITTFMQVGYQQINNTIVLDAPVLASDDQSSLQGPNQTGLAAAESSSTFIIKQQSVSPQTGTTNSLSDILQLQSGDANRLMVATSGALTLNAEVLGENQKLFVINNNGSELFSIKASGLAVLWGSLVVKQDLAVMGRILGTSAILAQNVSGTSLEIGDLVVLAGASNKNFGDIPVIAVMKSTASSPDAFVVGIVDRNMTGLINDQENSTNDSLPIGPDDYLSIVTTGSYKTLKVDSSGGAITTGDKLTLSATPGLARKWTVDDSLPVVGVALDGLATDTGTVRVFLMTKQSSNISSQSLGGSGGVSTSTPPPSGGLTDPLPESGPDQTPIDPPVVVEPQLVPPPPDNLSQNNPPTQNPPAEPTPTP